MQLQRGSRSAPPHCTPWPQHMYIQRTAPAVSYCDGVGADVRATSSDGKTALHQAAKQGNTAVVEALLAGGAEVFAVKPDTLATPLHHAAASGALTIAGLQALLDAGAPLEAQDSDGLTPLHWAVIRALQDEAALEQAAAAVRALLAAGASPLVPNVRGQTPLSLAADAGVRPLEELLWKAAVPGEDGDAGTGELGVLAG